MMTDDELVVLASLIADKTAAAAKRAIKAAKCDLEKVIVTAEARDNLLALELHGAADFEGYLGGRPVAELATPYVEKAVDRLMADWRRRLAETDRTLDEFETPGPDSDDPDCLFQNRWLRRGACGAIVSTSGVGKSSFSIQAATMWAAGEECLGVRPTRPLKIGIFQSEDDEYDIANFRDRIRPGLVEMGWNMERIRAAEAKVTFCALDGSIGHNFINYLRRKQEQYHFDLIIINPLFAFFGGDLNDGNAMTSFLRHGIDSLIKAEATKCGCIIIHHTGKPNKEKLALGNVFSAYLGSGSGEFTNYIRSALVITPYMEGKLPGVFDLIAAKHGDKLAWKDDDGMPTTKKVVCYANRLPEYAEKGLIFWMEPDAVQLAELKKSATAATSTANKPAPIDAAAYRMAEVIRTRWTGEVERTNADGAGQRKWLMKMPATAFGLKKYQPGMSRATREVALKLITVDPARFGLRAVDERTFAPMIGGVLSGVAEGRPLNEGIETEFV